MSKRYCLTLDLKDDLQLIAEYEEYHKAVWPEILSSITESGIIDMQLYRFGNRLFMIIEADEDFSFEKKQLQEASNSKVQEWEELMWKYQQPLPTATAGEKWMLMKNIFKLRDF